MAYCCQCGNPVADSDVYCGRCGARQPAPAASAEGRGLTPRTACVLCYVPFLGWVAAIVVLASERFRHNRLVRFHAFQGLYLFVAYLIVDWVVGPVFRMLPHTALRLDKLLGLGLVAVWIFMMVKASQERAYALPVLGELAEKSAAES